MTFLPPADLSALMRTCQLFADIALLPLCAHSIIPLKASEQILSFLRFLRLDRPSSSRASLIKDLTFSLEEYRAPVTKASYFTVQEVERTGPHAHPLMEEQQLRATRNSALEAFLLILRHCTNIRRVRVDRWFEDVPMAPLYRAITALQKLEDLRMPMLPRSQWGASEGSLANLPLRKLVLRPGRWFEIPEMLTALQPLATSLVELDIPVCQWVAPAVAFPHVRKLGIEFPASEDVVSALVRTFPNVTHLFLRGTRNFHLCHTHSSRQDEDRLREHSQYQWHSLTGSWPPLVTVGAETPCALYTLAIPFQVPRVSVTSSAGDPAGDMLRTILTDAHPTCLEMRVTQVHYKYEPRPPRFSGLAPGDATASLQRFILTMEGDGIPDYVKVSPLLIDELQRALANLSVTHVLFKYSIDHFRASRHYTRKVVRTVCAQAHTRAAAMAQAVPSLRWIGVYVRVKAGPTWLYCWDLVRLSERAQGFVLDPPPSVSLKEMSEHEGWDVLAEQEMDELARAD
ncbi:hypothetical protein K466DRAFT_489143 [Polyporus arcularius HHB13444]|uniref:F-box domain-containing protein n=1 Tax=Polyporus arcularius HHB13444 TaxID=1314778 RepID=A0A5C3PH14_9APHY|nr:hypothetical protein K466DRAFT_489143 [Polyporus arcularius HHB13444]